MQQQSLFSHYYALIMAGGGGTRLWPMSRKNTPKQLLPLIDDRTMFRTSVDRLAPLFTPDRIYIVTGPEYIQALRADAPEIPTANFIIEPYGRNTGPAAALGLWVIQQRDPHATVAILTADHYITKEDTFRDLLEAAHQLAQDGYIVTLGINPTFPATGFGYIRQGDKFRQIDQYAGYESRGFTEKPDTITATKFLASGEYSWNSGMFIWTAERAIQEFEQQQPQIYTLFQQLAPTIDTPNYQAVLITIWEKMPQISIDFAIMERAKQMAVIPADIGWNDIGSWAALFAVHQLDKWGNCFKGHAPERIVLDTQDTMVYSNRLIVTIGIEDLIVIDTEDVLLICHRDRAQDVKDVVAHLRATKNDAYL